MFINDPIRMNYKMKDYEKSDKTIALGAMHILRNAERGEGGQLKRYHCIFHLYKSIRISTKSVTWGEGGGIKNCQFLRYVICEQPLTKVVEVIVLQLSFRQMAVS